MPYPLYHCGGRRHGHIPMGTADGDYFLIIVADGTELVEELDEDNNAVPGRLRKRGLEYT